MKNSYKDILVLGTISIFLGIIAGWLIVKALPAHAGGYFHSTPPTTPTPPSAPITPPVSQTSVGPTGGGTSGGSNTSGQTFGGMISCTCWATTTSPVATSSPTTTLTTTYVKLSDTPYTGLSWQEWLFDLFFGWF